MAILFGVLTRSNFRARLMIFFRIGRRVLICYVFFFFLENVVECAFTINLDLAYGVLMKMNPYPMLNEYERYDDDDDSSFITRHGNLTLL